MAKATKQVEVKETLTGVTLELSVEEARTLMAILHYVGGHPRTTRRGYTDAVVEALASAGFGTEHPSNWVDRKPGSSIYFTEESMEGRYHE